MKKSCLRGSFILVLLVALSGCAIVGPALNRSNLKSEIRANGHVAATPHIHSDSGELLTAFRELGQAAGLDPKAIYVARQPGAHVNAASVGDRHFVVTEGALNGNKCLLWGLVAHELGHDVLNHADVNVATATALGVIATGVGVVVPGGGYLVQGLGWLGMRGFSRAQENSADAKAVEILQRAGKPPWALRYTLDYLRDVYGDSAAAFAWLSTHPAAVDRAVTQPAYNADEVERWCPSPEERMLEITAIRTAIAPELQKQQQAVEAATKVITDQRERLEESPGNVIRR